MEFTSNNSDKALLTLQQLVQQAFKQVRLKVSSCILCGNSCALHPLLCQYCQADLPYFKHPHIPYNLLNWPAITQLIPKNHFQRLLAVAPYVWPFDSWISQLKYGHKTELAELLSYLLVLHWQQYLNDDQPNLNAENTLITAVPLHIKKWQLRGFNQAHLIARKFAKNFDYPYYSDIVIRQRRTENQVGKSGKERRQNLKNAFALNKSALEQLPTHVILIDDVVTTGTTANEICKLLKKNGVQTITLLCISLALPT